MTDIICHVIVCLINTNMALTNSVTLGSLLLSRQALLRSKIEESELIHSKVFEENEDQQHKLLTSDEAVEKIGFGMYHVFILAYAGLLWFSAGLLLFLFSLLPDILKCEWGLSPTDEALLSSLTFVGIMFGSQLWGILADVYGRKKVLILVSFSNAALSLMTAYAPYFSWMVVLRILSGFTISAADIIITYIVEFLPSKYRGNSVISLELFFASGGIAVVALGLAMVQTVGWSWYLFASSMPAFLCAVLSLFLLPSPRFLVIKGRKEEAMNVFNKVAKINCKTPLEGILVTDLYKQKYSPPLDTSENGFSIGRQKGAKEPETMPLLSSQRQESIIIPANPSTETTDPEVVVGFPVLNLFRNGMWRTTLLLGVIWFVASMISYGMLLLATALFVNHQHCRSGSDATTLDVCHDLTSEDYLYLMWTLAAEIPGVLLAAIMLPFMGRRVVMAVHMILCTVFFAFLYFCWDRAVLTVFIFCSRAMISGVYQTLYVYTPEVYPTSVRTLGLCLCTAISYLGGAVSPYVLQVLVEFNDLAGISAILALCILTTVATVLLPIETRGKSLSDVVQVKQKKQK